MKNLIIGGIVGIAAGTTLGYLYKETIQNKVVEPILSGYNRVIGKKKKDNKDEFDSVK